MQYLRELEEDTKYLHNVPVSYSFQEKYVTGIIGAKNVVNPFIKGLILQMIAYHGYDTLKIAVLTNDRNTKFWQDIIGSPYFWDDNKTIRFFGTNNDDIAQISSYFEELLGVLKEETENQKNTSNKETPKLPCRYVIITDDIDQVRNVSIIRNIIESEEYITLSSEQSTFKIFCEKKKEPLYFKRNPCCLNLETIHEQYRLRLEYNKHHAFLPV